MCTVSYHKVHMHAVKAACMIMHATLSHVLHCTCRLPRLWINS